MTFTERVLEIAHGQARGYLRRHKMPPWIDFEDLHQEVSLRILWHLPRFDGSNEAMLVSFIQKHTTGAILDALRVALGRRESSGRLAVIVSLDDLESLNGQLDSLIKKKEWEKYQTDNRENSRETQHYREVELPRLVRRATSTL